jgi:hypothetical protein
MEHNPVPAAAVNVDAAATIGRDGKGKRGSMGKYQIAALVAVLGLIGLSGRFEALAAPKGAAPARVAAGEAASVSDLSAQRRRVRRAGLRIDVYPWVRSGRRIDLYPRPYPFEWPGPNAQRECIAWLAPEARLSGPVIVPRQRCWWVGG